MKLKWIAPVLVIALLSISALGTKDDNGEKRAKARKMAAQTLEDLYKLRPSAKTAIQKSAGHAVFNTWGRICCY
jgi:hypothetical protein